MKSHDSPKIEHCEDSPNMKNENEDEILNGEDWGRRVKVKHLRMKNGDFILNGEDKIYLDKELG